jgi:hypothetical protein
MGSSFFNMILSDMILFSVLSGSKPLPALEDKDRIIERTESCRSVAHLKSLGLGQ